MGWPGAVCAVLPVYNASGKICYCGRSLLFLHTANLGICVIVFQYNAGACRVNPFPMNGTGREPGDIGAAGGNGDRRQSWQQVVVVNVAAGGDTTHVVMKPGWRRSRGREAVGAEMLSRHDEEIRTRAAVWGTAMVAGESSGCI